MSESMLQREFRERDVQRMRNIIKKEYTAKTAVQVGYTKLQEEHKEGDVWEENGKKWTLKNGVKQTVTRLDKLKEYVILPLTCPKCNKAMKNNNLNKKMWSIHKMCFDCVINIETNLKTTGQYEAYASNLIKQGVKAYIKDLENILLEVALESNESFVTEDGDIEKWAGKGINKTKITHELQDHIQKLKKHVDD